MNISSDEELYPLEKLKIVGSIKYRKSIIEGRDGRPVALVKNTSGFLVPIEWYEGRINMYSRLVLNEQEVRDCPDLTPENDKYDVLTNYNKYILPKSESPSVVKHTYNFFFNPKSTWMFIVTFIVISYILVSILAESLMFFDRFLFPQISFIVVGGIFFYALIKFMPYWTKFDERMRQEKQEEENNDK